MPRLAETKPATGVLSALVVLLPLLWIIGVHVNDLARVLAMLLALMLVFGHGATATKLPGRGVTAAAACLALFVAAFVVFNVAQPIADVFLGRQVVDFAIFSQVVDSIATRGTPLSSLIAMEWRNFLTHHFTPILYVPGALAALGMPAYAALSVAHGVAVALAALAVWKIARALDLSRFFALFAVALTLATPTFRQGALGGPHDELFALPFVGFAYLAWLKRRPVAMVLCLVGASLTKESLFLVAAAFGVMVLVDGRRRDRVSPRAGLLLLAYGLMGFAAYAFLQPLLLGKGFDHADKLASLAELVRPDWVAGKLLFLGFLGLPFLWYPLWRRASWALLLPATPLVGLVLVSRFDEMWRLMNYYGVVPAYVLSLASLVALARTGVKTLPAPVAALLLAVAFSWGGSKPAKAVWDLAQGPRLAAAQLARIPSEARVIAGPPGALFLFRTAVVWRLWLANGTPPPDFDYIVTRASGDDEVGPALLARSEPCGATPLWRIRCRRGGRFSW